VTERRSAAGVWIGGALAAVLPLFTCPTREGAGEFHATSLTVVHRRVDCPRRDGR
jgi:hypothetical protein